MEESGGAWEKATQDTTINPRDMQQHLQNRERGGQDGWKMKVIFLDFVTLICGCVCDNEHGTVG